MKTSTSRWNRPILTIALATLWMTGPNSSAASKFWTNTGPDEFWRNSANWQGGGMLAGDTPTFNTATPRATYNDFAAGTAFAGISFRATAGAFTLEGNSITLTGTINNASNVTQTINLDIALNANRTINTQSGDLVIDGAVSGAYSLIKTGDHRLILSGVNTFSGLLDVRAGSVELRDSSSTGAALSGNAISLINGSTLELAHFGDASAANRNLGILTLGLGQQTIRIDEGENGGTMALTFASLGTRTAYNSYLHLDLRKGGSVAFTAAPTPGNISNTAFGHLVISETDGIGFAAAPTSGVALARVATSALTADFNQLDGNVHSNTSDYTGGIFTMDSGTHRLNTLNISTAGGPGTLDLNGSRLEANSGGGILFSGSADYSITNGTIAINGGTSTEVNFAQIGSGVVTLNATVSLGHQGFVKTGEGILALANPFDLTSGNAEVHIHQGTLHLLDSRTLHGNADLSRVLSRVVLNADYGITFAEVVGGQFGISNLQGSGDLLLEDATGAAVHLTLYGNRTNTFSGDLSGAGSLTIDGGSFQLSGVVNLEGGIRIKSGTLQALGADLNEQSIVMDSGILRLTTLGGASASVLTLSRFEGAAGALTTLSGNHKTLVVNNGLGESHAYLGVLENGSYTMSFRKEGEGTQILGGQNTYTGTTTVAEGALIINGALSSSSEVSVSSGAKLGGNGTVGAVTFANGARFSPGNSIGRLTVDSAVLEGAATYQWEVQRAGHESTAGTGWDQLSVTGVLDLRALSEAQPLTISLTSLGIGGTPGLLDGWDASVDDRWEGIVLATGGILFGAGGFDASLFEIDATAFLSDGSLGNFSVAFNGTDRLDLVYIAPIPEPATWVTLGLGAALLAFARRRAC